jgi:hypothetical protein
MTNRVYSKYSTFDGGWAGPLDVCTADYSLVSGNSGRGPNGKLVLQQNPIIYRHDRILRFDVVPGRIGGLDVTIGPQGASTGRHDTFPPGFDWGPLDNQASARFNGKLSKGGASLGVTIASWKQSQEMIVKRLGTVKNGLDRSILRLTRDKRLLKRIQREREPLAGQILETEFGWIPLVQDLRAALTTAFTDAIPPEFVKGVGLSDYDVREGNLLSFRHYTGRARVTYTAKVEISNPNLWLLNRMGLVNLPGVLWDLVPWSFVANMFGNFNQLISSFTAEVGLNVTDRSVTRSVNFLTHAHAEYNVPQSPVTDTWLRFKYRHRVPGASPPLQFVAKVPKLNWELCLIAGALVVQRIDRINKLIRLL